MRKMFRSGREGVSLKASLTIEAALALPLFMFFVTAVIYFLAVISLQSSIQLAMEEAARTLGKQAYLTAQTETDHSINYLTIRSAILTSDLKEEIDNSAVKNGADGVSTLLSTYNEESGILDLVVTYTYVIPFLPEKIAELNLLQRIRCRAWIGRDVSGEAGGASEGTIVYITPTGTVYHTTTSCPYLDLSVRSVAFSEVDAARNKSGSRYTACTSCCKKTSYSLVYVTDYGTSYHSSLSCSRLKRTVIAIDISEVDGRGACSKCAGE